MTEAKIIAKIENMEGLVNYKEIMEQCDVMLLSRGSMGNCVDPEKMFLAQKMLLRVRDCACRRAVVSCKRRSRSWCVVMHEACCNCGGMHCQQWGGS